MNKIGPENIGVSPKVPMSESKKPIGIVLIALYSGFCGIAFLPVGCMSMMVGGMPGIGALPVFVGIIATILGFLLLASVYGLWTIQQWGRSLSFWIYIVEIPLGVLMIFPVFSGMPMNAGNTLLQLLGIAVDLIVIAYLASPEVRRFFDSESTQSELDPYTRREPR
jgi:hypothetical protein